MTDSLWAMSAAELARRVKAREVSPVEVLDAYMRRIESLNPGLNAIVTLREEVHDEAKAAEAAVLRNEPLGSLHGVPFTAKDSFDTAGCRTTRGSLLFAEHVPDADATAVARLRQAGALLLGKTNVPEFVLWAETDNRVFGPTVNPWDSTRTAGGSSGGEAAAIAAGLSPLGVGSDLSGSIRLPANHCGIIGLKPTHGRVPLTGHWPATLSDYCHVGPMARTVEDIRLALQAMEGPDCLDWHAQSGPVEAGGSSLGRLQVSWVAGESFGPLDPEVAAAVETAAKTLGEVAATVRQTPIRVLDECDFDLLTMDLYGAESSRYFDAVIDGRHDLLHDVFRARLGHPKPSLDRFLDTREVVTRLRAELLAHFAEYDILLCPVTPTPAPPRGLPQLSVGNQQVRGRSILRATIPFDLSGHPAASVPFARSSDGLPIGVQVVGRPGQDHMVLDVAEWLLDQVGDRPIAEPQGG